VASGSSESWIHTSGCRRIVRRPSQNLLPQSEQRIHADSYFANPRRTPPGADAQKFGPYVSFKFKFNAVLLGLILFSFCLRARGEALDYKDSRAQEGQWGLLEFLDYKDSQAEEGHREVLVDKGHRGGMVHKDLLYGYIFFHFSSFS